MCCKIHFTAGEPSPFVVGQRQNLVLFPFTLKLWLANAYFHLHNLALLCRSSLVVYYISSMGCWCFQLQLLYVCPLFPCTFLYFYTYFFWADLGVDILNIVDICSAFWFNLADMSLLLVLTLKFIFNSKNLMLPYFSVFRLFSWVSMLD